jgi:hypothetical protein
VEQRLWFHHIDPETEGQIMECCHTTSPKKNKPKTIPSAYKTMETVFWDAEGSILLEFVPQEETIIAAHYLQMLQK